MDLIERQAAIDAIRSIKANYCETADDQILLIDKAMAMTELMMLPSAQPETHEERTEKHACDCISRQAAIRWVKTECNPYGKPTIDFESGKKVIEHLEQMPSAQPDVPDADGDMISRKLMCDLGATCIARRDDDGKLIALGRIDMLPSAQPEQRYTEEELRVFRHGISLSLLSKRSSQHWHYDDDTATEIEFLERLYEKVGADMRGDEDE